MNHSLRLIVALLVPSAVLTAQAQTGTGHHAPGRLPSPILAVLDADGNGTLSAAEIAAAPLKLNALDANGDGMISPAERRATNLEGRPVRTAFGASAFNVVLALDANLDGDLQWLEIANAVMSLQRLDRNGDGQLTPDELRPAAFAVHRA